MFKFILLLTLFFPLLIEAGENRQTAILDYWFGTLSSPADYPSAQSKLWFMKSDQTDREITEKFSDDLKRAAAGQYDSWKQTPRGKLALVILLDQMSRNIYRGTPKAFATDPKALQITLEAIHSGDDLKLYPIERAFLYMPLEHSEDPDSQKLSIEYFQKLFNESPKEMKGPSQAFLKYALDHKKIIDRFGRYPHRNQILGRVSTPEEVEFLKQPGSSY